MSAWIFQDAILIKKNRQVSTWRFFYTIDFFIVLMSLIFSLSLDYR